MDNKEVIDVKDLLSPKFNQTLTDIGFFGNITLSFQGNGVTRYKIEQTMMAKDGKVEFHLVKVSE